MSALTARIVEEYASVAPTLPSSPALAAHRHAAIEALRSQGLPGPRDENWKYANLRPLERLRFTPAAAGSLPAAALPAELPGYARYVFADGNFVPAQSAPLTATAALLTPLAQASAPAAERTPHADERLALLNQAFATDGMRIRVPAGGEGAVRLELVFVASADAQAGASYPRIELQLDADTQLVLIERHLSANQAPGFVNSAALLELGRAARLEHYRLQELNARSTLFDTLSAHLAQDAGYSLHGICTGAQAARSTLGVRLCGERARVALGIAALGDGGQLLDTYALVEHAAPATRTQQTFRGIAAGRARVAFNGKIVVRSAAPGSDSRQSLRGLLAGAGAEIDARPQLEIYTDDVRCSHGATAGKLDDNMLFYLLSRGLSAEVAQSLLKWAFLEDVVAQFGVPELRRQIERHLAGQLRDDTLRELL